MDNNDSNWTQIGDAVSALLAGLSLPLTEGSNVISFEAAYERRRDRTKEIHATLHGSGSGELVDFENCVKTRCGGIRGHAS